MRTSIRWAMAGARSMTALFATMGTTHAAAEPVDGPVAEALRAIAAKPSLVTKLGTEALGISVSLSAATWGARRTPMRRCEGRGRSRA